MVNEFSIVFSASNIGEVEFRVRAEREGGGVTVEI